MCDPLFTPATCPVRRFETFGRGPFGPEPWGAGAVEIYRCNDVFVRLLVRTAEWGCRGRGGRALTQTRPSQGPLLLTLLLTSLLTLWLTFLLTFLLTFWSSEEEENNERGGGGVCNLAVREILTACSQHLSTCHIERSLNAYLG